MRKGASRNITKEVAFEEVGPTERRGEEGHVVR